MAEDICEPVVDLLTRVLQLRWVTRLRGVELTAVATASALRLNRHLIDLGAVLQLGDPLPWVLLTVGEENVGGVDAVAITVLVESLLDVWVDRHVQAKDLIALVSKVLLIDEAGAHLVDPRGGLEPSKLSAVLPRPLSTGVIEVDGCGLNLRAGASFVLPWPVTLVKLVVDCCNEQFLLWHVLVVVPNGTELLGMTILDVAAREVSHIGQEIIGVHVGSWSASKDIGDGVWLTSIS